MTLKSLPILLTHDQQFKLKGKTNARLKDYRENRRLKEEGKTADNSVFDDSTTLKKHAGACGMRLEIQMVK
jgi:hypothetical protein